MHILFLTFYFPPYNTMGAVRTGKTAKYLEQMGHRVSVVSASPQALPPSLPLEIAADHVTYTKWMGRPQAKKLAMRSEASHTEEPSGIRTLARRVYWWLMMPDENIGWFPFAWRAARRVLERHDVDVIFASAGPFTSLLLAAALARTSNLPWVGELRDPWMDNAYRQKRVVRDALERRLELRTLRSASALVTVSPAWTTLLAHKVNRPVELVYNGYEPDVTPRPPRVTQVDHLVLRHTGSVWEKRVPHGLFRCLRALEAAGTPVSVEFYGHDLDVVRRAASELGVQHLVQCHASVSHEESLRLQRGADVLLLTMSEALPGEQQFLPGKLFEYMSACRPILLLGCPDGVAADLLRSHRCGAAPGDEAELMGQLQSWLLLKREAGQVPATGPPPGEFTRVNQTRRLAAVLQRAADTR